MTTSTATPARRAAARRLLNDQTLSDALASYYVFYHSIDRTDLFLQPTDDQPEAFLVRARTGLDLFRPLVTFRAASAPVAETLFRTGLQPGRPVYLTVPEALGPLALRYLVTSEIELHRIYRYQPGQHPPQINILAQLSKSADGAPRCEIRSGGQTGAVAGVNWQSPRFAEVYVYTDPAVRGRGWGRTVVSQVADQLVRSGRQPLYVVAESNTVSIHLAEAVGFVDTGLREFVAQAMLTN